MATPKQIPTLGQRADSQHGAMFVYLMNYWNPSLGRSPLCLLVKDLRLGPGADPSSRLRAAKRESRSCSVMCLWNVMFLFLICMCYAQTITCSSKKLKVFLYVSLNCLTPPLLLKLTTNLWVVVDFCLNYLPTIWELRSRGWGAVDIDFWCCDWRRQKELVKSPLSLLQMGHLSKKGKQWPNTEGGCICPFPSAFKL